MATYSIKDLESLSGIKAHTIRIWEQRYKLLSPKRTETNIRLYGDHDLKLLLSISLLYNEGYKISKIAQMSCEEINQEVINITDTHYSFDNQIKALTIAMIEMDEGRFEKILSTSILQNGFSKTMLEIIYPFLEHIGILWQIGAINPAQEHFISNLIRQKIIVAIDGQVSQLTDKSKKFLLFLPENELHEIGLLFSHFLIKSQHHKVFYLGASVPLNDVKEVYDIHRPEYVLSIFTAGTHIDLLKAWIKELSDKFPKSKLLIAGPQTANIKAGDVSDNVILINSFHELNTIASEA